MNNNHPLAFELLDATAITLDIDWAPDWCIEQACRTLAARGVRGTFFATHRSPLIEDLIEDDRFEVGIHPNFLSHTTQGSSVEDILGYCLDIVPDARAVRTHSLFQSIPLLSLLSAKYPQIDVDVSLFLPLHPDLRPVAWHYHECGSGLIRLPYYWQDDVFAGWPGWQWDSMLPKSRGLKIFDFHPVLLALNINDLKGYMGLKQHMGNRPLFTATKEDFEPFTNKGWGDRNFLDMLIDLFGPDNFSTISEITAWSAR